MERGGLAEQIGHLLRAEREKARLSQEALARAAGMAQQAVSRLESGRSSPTTAVVERLFAALGLQLRLDVEPVDAELDRLTDLAEDDPEAVAADLDNLHSLLRWGRDLPYLLDGVLAARLHGLPAPLTGAFCLAVAEADLGRLSAWIRAIPNCRRYSERWRDFSDFEVDPARPGPMRWRTPFGELSVRLLAELPDAVTVRHGDREVPLRPLPDIERDDPQVARLLRRQRDR